MESLKHIRISIEPKTFLLAGGFLLLGFFVARLSNLILVVLTAVVLASFIESVVRAGKKIRLPRTVTVFLFYLISFIVFSLIIYIVIPIFINELIGFFEIFPPDSFVASLGQFLSTTPLQDGTGLIGSASQTDPIVFLENLGGTFSAQGFFESMSTAFGSVVNFILIVVISFYLSIQEKGVEQFLRIVTPVDYENYVIDVWNRVDTKIRGWFRGQVFIALITTILTYICLLIIGMPYALILSLIVGIFELVPFGIIVAYIPAALLAFLGGGLPLFILVTIIYFVIQQIENYILQPLIIKNTTGVPSLIVIIAVVAGVTLAGFLGLVLAIPFSVLVLELVYDAEKRKIREQISENTSS